MGASERRDRHLLTAGRLLAGLTGVGLASLALTGCAATGSVGATSPVGATGSVGAAGSAGSSGPTGRVGATAPGTATGTGSAASPTRMLTPPPRPPRRPVTRPAPEPAFSWTVSKVSARTLGRSWHRGCPVPPAKLRSVAVRFWGFDHKPHTGVLVLHRDVVKRTEPVFAAMFERNFPIRGIRPVSEFGASDDASMAADNTSAFNCRRAVAAGPPSWSRHAYGRAVDVNPVENPYLFGRRVLPPAGAKFTDRGSARPGLIRRRDPIYRAFLKAGYRWGGDFSNPDYQHFDR